MLVLRNRIQRRDRKKIERLRIKRPKENLEKELKSLVERIKCLKKEVIGD